MNIGIFSDTYFPQLNGVATSIRTLTHALREKGHTVYIFTPSDPRCEGQPESEACHIPDTGAGRSSRGGYCEKPEGGEQLGQGRRDYSGARRRLDGGFVGV